MTRFDLHVHSALSACAEDVMSPRQILQRAAAADLQLLAITDHNASATVPPALQLAGEFNLTVIPGMEVSSREEAHVLAYFPDYAGLRSFQELVDTALPPEPNAPEMFGHQLVYDAADEIVALDERLRQVGTTLELDRLRDEIKARGGYVAPAHAYRRRFSLWSQLGWIDPAAGFDALEIDKQQWRREGYRLGRRVEGYPVFAGSDAHFLEDVGRWALEIPETVTTLDALFAIITRDAGEWAP